MTMEDTKEIIYSLDEVPRIARLLWELRTQCKVFTFNGHLGAGKTTLVKEILRVAGVKDVITSPTFTYVNLYQTPNKEQLYHFDLYRITTLEEFLAQGFDEYLYAPHAWSFIEWPEVIMPLLQHNVCHCSIDYEGEDRRKLMYTIIT
jgi:tRNA threonylcarbamoyladenosine biosynthesis protein TsaE